VLPFRLAEIGRVEFYKRDELTTDLACCEVAAGGVVHFSHEEAPAWDDLVRDLRALPGFDADWFARVSQPPFAERRICAFERC
jgi:hypothetical protein